MCRISLVATVQPVALWVALGALGAKELLFRYMLGVAKRVKSSMLVANAWHARSDAASSLVVAIGIGGNLLGYPILDPIAALVVGLAIPLSLTSALVLLYLTGQSDKAIFEILLQREKLGSTGVGNGVAIPHGKLPKLGKVFGLFARLERPVDFEAPGGPRLSFQPRFK